MRFDIFVTGIIVDLARKSVLLFPLAGYVTYKKKSKKNLQVECVKVNE